MEDINKKLPRFLIIFIFITTMISCSTTNNKIQKPAPVLSINERQAFQSAKVIRLLVTQNFQDGDKVEVIKFDKLVNNLFQDRLKLKIVGADAEQFDATLKIVGSGRALADSYVSYNRTTQQRSGKPVKLYTGMKGTLEVSFEINQVAKVSNEVDLFVEPARFLIGYGSAAPWTNIYHKAENLLYQTVGQAYGVSYLMNIMGESKNYDYGSMRYALTQIGEPAVQPLSSFLMDPSVALDLKSTAMDTLSSINSSSAIDPLVWLVINKESKYAAFNLGQSSNVSAVEPLIDAMIKLNHEGKPIDYILEAIYKLVTGSSKNYAIRFEKDFPGLSKDPQKWKDWWSLNKSRYAAEKK